ncbi:coiled-coiled domain protein [Faustovirus]|nr:coiled-coiled domain protein [Faustovirus]
MQVVINYKDIEILSTVEYLKHADIVGKPLPNASMHYRLVIDEYDTIESLTAESSNDYIVVSSKLHNKGFILYIVDNVHTDYIIIWRIKEITGDTRMQLIDINDLIRDNFKRLIKKPLFSGLHDIFSTTFNIQVLDEGNNYHSSRSAVMRVCDGKVVEREDTLMGPDIRGITFKHTDNSNNIFIRTQREIMAHATPHMTTMQVYYDMAIRCITIPEHYGIRGYKACENAVDKLTDQINTLAVNRDHSIDIKFKIVHSVDEMPVIKFNNKIDIGALEFKFALESSQNIYVLINGKKMFGAVEGLEYDNGIAIVRFPPGTRANELTFYTHERIINRDLTAVSIR